MSPESLVIRAVTRRNDLAGAISGQETSARITSDYHCSKLLLAPVDLLATATGRLPVA